MENQLIAFLEEADISNIQQNNTCNLKLFHSKSTTSKIAHNRLKLRMIQNKNQRQMLQAEKRHYHNYLIQKRKNKQIQVFNRLMKTRNQRRIVPQYIKHNNRTSITQQKNRQKSHQDPSQSIVNKDEIRQFDINQKIQIRRKKVQLKRIAQMQRIHQRNQSQMKKNREKLVQIQKITDQKTDKHHLKQWNNYEKKLIQKYNRQHNSSSQNFKIQRKTLQLYNRYKQKQCQLNKIIKSKSKDDEKENSQLNEPKQAMSFLNNNKKTQNFKIKKKSKQYNTQQSKAVQEISYFGLQRQPCLKDYQSLINKLHQFISYNRSCVNLEEDLNLLQKVEKILQL